MKIQAPAKINPALDVTGRRADGYHELCMVMQTVSLYDEIELEIGERTELIISGLPIPADSPNLALRAANLLTEEFRIPDPLRIRLTKRIPVAAGLAGGSADAAAVLRGVNELFRLGLSRGELMQRALKLGADVPFCVMGGTAQAEGIGEELTELPPMPPCCILLAKPGVAVSTQFVYTNFCEERVETRPDIPGMRRALAEGDLGGIADRLCNVLESVTIPAHPVIAEIKDILREQGARGALMSGSGPTVFAVFDDRSRAEAALAALEERNMTEMLYLASPCGAGEIA